MKLSVLSGRYAMMVSETVDGKVDDMCNLGEGIYKEGVEDGHNGHTM